MVSEMTTGLEEEQEGFVPDEDNEEIPDSPEPQEEEADPVAELANRVAQMEEIANRLRDFDPQEVRRGLGQVRSLQSKIDSLTNSDPLSAINPRVATNEELLGSLVDALISSDILEDSSKSSLRAARERLVQSKTEQEWQRREQELLSKVKSTTSEEQTPDEETERYVQYVNAKTTELRGYARAKGIDFTSIPASELLFKSGETVDQAFDRVVGLIDEKATEGSATDRLAGRRKAAGSGSPSRSGGSDNIDQIMQRLENEGIPLTDEKSRKAAMQRLGLA